MVAPTRHKRTLTAQQSATRRLDVTSPAGLPVVEKDLLRVGHWHLGGSDTWHVSPKTLRDLAANYRKATEAGNRIPWIVNHDGGAGGRIGDVIGVEVRGDTLVGRLQVTDRRHAELFGGPGDETFHEVSVEVQEPWQDGEGNSYPLALTHVANVINPVVTRQGPFRRVLSNTTDSTRKVRQMAESEDMPEGEGEGETITIAEVKEILSDVLGVSVPEQVDDKKSLMAWLVGLNTTPGQGGAEEEAPAEEITAPAGESVPPIMMSLKREIEGLKRQLSVKEKGEREAYHAEVDSLVADNCLTPAEGSSIKTTADGAKFYSLSLLKPYRKLKAAVNTQRRASLGASASPPLAGAISEVKAIQNRLSNGVFSVNKSK